MARRNVTITLEPEVARWVRVAAAEREMSVARFVGELLRQQMAREAGYAASMESFLAWKPRPLRAKGEAYPSRDELHDRQVLR